LITVKNVNKFFDDYHALNDLSINVNKGSIYGLVGTNGSGKTTIIKHLTGVLKQDSGEILFDGEPVYENEELKKKIGFIPDDLSYLATFTMRDAVKYYRSVYPVWDEERYADMMEKFGLGSRKRIHSFSKGMQKQAAFILTMCTHPSYLILDEPIDGLDPIIRRLVWKYIIEDVSESGMTVLISSHNLREMEGICDCIGILDRGEMKIERDLDELKSDIHKVQVAYSEDGDHADKFEGLNILHREQRGSVDLLIVRNEKDFVRRTLDAGRPLIFDMLPLTLEEIFIYELGGENYEIKDIIF
jgi:ABC-2 type transport system ATP-binding protein